MPEVQSAIPKKKIEDRPIQIKPICLVFSYMYGLLDEVFADDEKI